MSRKLPPGIRRLMGLGAFRQSALARELQDELAFHLEARAEQLMSSGVSRDEAYRLARQQYGHVDHAEREIERFAQRRSLRRSTIQLFDTMYSDLRFALRTMRRQPGWVVVAIMALALGIGANTAVFSVINDLMIDPLHYPHPERLIVVTRQNAKSGVSVTASVKSVEAWRHAQSLEGIEGAASQDVTITGDGDPRVANVTYVSSTFFSFAGARIILGRGLRSEEVDSDAPVVLLAESYWRAQYHASKQMLDRTMTIDGKVNTIIGVVADGVRVSSYGGSPPELWRPLAITLGSLSGPVVARLKPGITPNAAEAELRAITAAQERAAGSDPAASSFPIHVAEPGGYGLSRGSLLLLGGAVIMLLLIACANVAHLLIARGAAREREIAVRAALGAGRGRLVRQLLTESLVLAGAGCVAGLVVGYVGVRLIVAMRPASMADLANVHVDQRVVLVTVGISLVTGIAFGVFSALGNVRGNFLALRSGGDASTSRRRHRMRAVLVVSEMALSVMLLVGATLLIRTMINYYRVDPGFDAHGLYALELHLPESRYPKSEDRTAYVKRLIDAVQQTPELRDFTLASAAPTHAGGILGEWEVEGQSKPTSPGDGFTFSTTVRPGYFESMRIPLVAGRAFTSTDKSDEQTVTNASLARQLWGTTSVVGRHFRTVSRGSTHAPVPWRTVVGVIDDAATASLGTDRQRGVVYSPSEVGGANQSFALIARVRGAFPAAATRTLQLSLDPTLPPATPIAVSALLLKTVARERFMMTLLTIFAGIAIALSAIGLYGVIAYMVSQRTREIGVRIALGADARDIRRLILSRGAALACVGLALGIVGAIAGTRVLRESLYGVTPGDPLSFAIGGLSLLVIAMLACGGPARRAARVDPAVAMRAD